MDLGWPRSLVGQCRAAEVAVFVKQLGRAWSQAAGRLGEPADIRGLSVFLASDASSWITGALIPMDGGNLAMNAGATIGR